MLSRFNEYFFTRSVSNILHLLYFNTNYFEILQAAETSYFIEMLLEIVFCFSEPEVFVRCVFLSMVLRWISSSYFCRLNFNFSVAISFRF